MKTNRISELRVPSDQSISNTVLESILVRSDIEYFLSGATRADLMPGILSTIPGFTKTPGGCVAHSLPGEEPFNNPDQWLKKLESLAQKAAASSSRIYLQRSPGPLDQLLRKRGYQRSIEVGKVSPQLQKLAASDIKLVRLDGDEPEHNKAKMAIYKASETSPDGHKMDASLFCDFEQLKCKAGYMTPFLAQHEGRIVGTVGLAMFGQMGRAKNLLVHPHFRGRGLSTKIIQALMHKVIALGGRFLGAYALDNSIAQKMYHGLGFAEVTRQYEWLKPL